MSRRSDPTGLWVRGLLAVVLTACGDSGTSPGNVQSDLGPLADAAVDAAAPRLDLSPPPSLPPYEVPEGCNPVAAEWDCFAPFPSDAFRVVDATQPSGFRVEIPEPARPLLERGGRLNMLALHPADGFSPIQQIVTRVPFELAPDQLVTLDGDFSVSLRPESRTVIVDAETGERVLHIAETDLRAPDPTRRALLLRPQVRLADGRRYVVGLRRLRDVSGADIVAPRPFLDVRDGTGAAPAALTEHLNTQVFPVLAQAGVQREDLLLAWDFTTRSRAQVERDLLTVRDRALAAFRATAPLVEIDTVDDAPESGAFRQVDGRLTVPLFMENDQPGALLHRDAEGLPAQNGTAQVPFVLLIPQSVAAADAPARFLQFGHGFFGSKKEAQRDFVPTFAERNGMVVAAVDWWGMSSADTADVLSNLSENASVSMRFTDRVHQGMVNFLALAHVAREGLLDVDATRVDARPTIDPSAVYFYGISQGGILGGTYLALSPLITRGALSVGGAGFSMLMQRARPFAPFLGIIAGQAPDPLDQQKVITLTQLSLDRVDPMTWAPRLFDAPLEGAPADRRIVMQLGLGDAQVPTLGHHAMARSLGLPLLAPSPRAVFGLETVPAPHDGSALVEYAFGVPEPLPGTFGDLPTEETVAHEGVRRAEGSLRQLDAFFRPDGRIEHFCDGPCDPN